MMLLQGSNDIIVLIKSTVKTRLFQQNVTRRYGLFLVIVFCDAPGVIEFLICHLSCHNEP